MKTNIALIGFMGVGKSAIGQSLAERLGKHFVEVDSLIEKKAGKSIPQIFQECGEIGFRELEIETIKDICGLKNQVIACGGGVVLNKINIDRLKLHSVIIWLTASPSTIVKRTKMDAEKRPILKGIDDVRALQSLIQFRHPYYSRAADLKINTTKISVQHAVIQIINQLKEYENISS